MNYKKIILLQILLSWIMKWKLKLEAGEQLVGTVVIHDDQNDRVTAAEKGFEIGEKCHEQEQIN